MNPIVKQGKFKSTVIKHELTTYFIMAYLFSWITLIPYILSQWHILPVNKIFDLFFVLNPYTGPALSAIIINRIILKKDARLLFWKRLINFKVGLKWYIFVILIIPAFLVIGVIVLPGAISSFHSPTLSFIIGYPINFIVIFFFGGPFGEEIGWRGFALPRLQSRYGAFKATLILGALWTFWHLPHFFTVAQRGGPGTDLSVFYLNLPLFFLMVMCLTVIFTWVYNNTKGSLFISILLHASINTFGVALALFSAPIVNNTDLPILIGAAIPAILIIARTRGRLGYNIEMK